MPSLLKNIVCIDCQHEMEPDIASRSCTECGSTWLEAKYDLTKIPENWTTLIKERNTDLWRYEELLPDTSEDRISMNEGWTPLVRAKALQQEFNLNHIFIKDERQSPTGSFKDRQGAMVINALVKKGINECVLASTGNKAAAYAAFCARANIRAWIFLTSLVPNEKLRELALYGAEVIKIAGTYDQAKKVSKDFAERRNIYYDPGSDSVAGREGLKTIAFELAEQLSKKLPVENGKWRAPDWYIQAVSGGIGVIAVYDGFKQLKELGLIDKIPKLGIIQVEGCSPMVTAWQDGKKEEAEGIVPRTRIAVLATGNPGRSYQLLRQYCIDTGGTMISVTDGEAFRAMRKMARMEGYSVEPAAAVAFAGLEKMAQENLISKDEHVVVNCSGHTFPAEKHILEDQYVLDLQLGEKEDVETPTEIEDGLGAALERLDEQVTTIVVIDDNPQDSRLIRRLLQSYKNYRVFEANSAIDGLDLVRHRKPDLVVTDLTMPEMDGFDLLRALKQDAETSKIPVIVISAKTLNVGDHSRLDKAESVWQKGNFNTRQLVDHVVRTLGGDEATDDTVISATVNDVANELKSALDAVNRANIMVVDDNRRDARLVKRILESTQRYSVHEAYSGKEAFSSLSEVSPRLFVLDLLLPDQSGQEIIHEIRKRADYKETPIVVLTAKSLSEAEKKFFQEQKIEVWQKAQLDRKALISFVENVLTDKNEEKRS